MSAGNARFLFNDGDTATITATETPIFPTANLLRQDRGYIWRSTSGVDQSLKGTWGGSSYPLSGFALVRHNLTAAGTLRLRIFSTTDWTGAALYDSGVVTLGTMLGWGVFEYGVDPWGGSNIFASWSYAFATFWFDEVVGRSYQLDLSDPGVTRFEASRIIIGKYFSPEENVSEGADVHWEDDSEQHVTMGGTLYTDDEQVYRVWDMQLASLSESERAVFMEIAMKVGKKKDFFVSLYPEWGAELERDHAGLVKITKMPGSRQHHNNRFASDLSLREC